MPVDYNAYSRGRGSIVPGLVRDIAGAYGQFQKIQAMQQQQQRQQEFQTDITALTSNPAATVSDYTDLAVKYPEAQQRIQGVHKMLGEEKARQRQAQALQLFSLLEGGENEMASKMLNDRKLAAIDAGRDTEAQQTQMMIDLINANPAAAKNSAGMTLAMSMGPDKFADTYKKIQETRELRGKEQLNIDTAAEELGLKKAQANKIAKETEKLDIETQKAVLELEAAKDPSTGIVDQEKRFNAEKKLRDEYDKKSAGLTESRRSYEILKTSAKDQSGAGDVALITSFMKMLDPGSVVRETEFATARDTAGLYTSLQNALQKAKTGQFLNVGQRKAFVNLAGKYLRAAKEQDKETREDMGMVVKNYKLNPDNVFGIQRDYTKKAGETDQDILNQADSILGL